MHPVDTFWWADATLPKLPAEERENTMTMGTNIEIRAASAGELPELMRKIDYAFANNQQPGELDAAYVQPEQTLCAFDGERMVATSGAFDLQMRFNGRAVAADGVTLVSCDPGYRRHGIVRQLMEGLLNRAKEREVPIAALWASMGAIYQRFGYGLATTLVGYEIQRPYVQFQMGESPDGYVRLLDPEEALPTMKGLYKQYSAAGTGLLHRGGFWPLMIRRQQDQHTHVAMYYDESGEPRGYCLYRAKWRELGAQGPNHLIQVFDFVWLDMAAYRGLWEYLARHDLADRIRFAYVAEDDPAPNLLLEPRMLERKTMDGVWLRVVDAEQTFTARGYDLPGEVTVEVEGDELCPWNNGLYRISAAGGGVEGAVEVERLNGGTADIVTPPQALASLVMGHTRVSDLARMGRLKLEDQKRGPELDAFFATRRRPHCPNMF
jgi:predicted acetyltransferase